MRKIAMISILTALAVTMVHVPSKGPFAKEGAQQFEVLGPWAEVDAIPLRGISPRVDTLAGKKVGLFANFKRAAKPILADVEKRLKAKYPDIKTSLFDSQLPNVTETETVNKEKFTAWAKDMDAVVGAVAD
jgi:hypothetical protein